VGVGQTCRSANAHRGRAGAELVSVDVSRGYVSTVTDPVVGVTRITF
jgi:hypothetical protein